MNLINSIQNHNLQFIGIRLPTLYEVLFGILTRTTFVNYRVMLKENPLLEFPNSEYKS